MPKGLRRSTKHSLPEAPKVEEMRNKQLKKKKKKKKNNTRKKRKKLNLIEGPP